MRKRRWLGLAAAGAGAAAAALTTGVVVERRVVRTRKAGARGADELGALHSDPVVLFGDGRDGAPTAQDWAEACGTISYEIVTRIGGRFVRRHVSAKGLMNT